MQKELLEQQLKVNLRQELTAYLLLKSNVDDVETDEKVHVIGRKLKHLIEQVSCDLKTIQGDLDARALLLVPGDLDSGVYNQVTEKSNPAVKQITVRRASDDRRSSSRRGESHPQPIQATPQTPYFFYRVLRAAFPLQLFLLLLLLVVCIIPSSEEDYSCTRANNFARSLHLMLQYLNGPPPI